MVKAAAYHGAELNIFWNIIIAFDLGRHAELNVANVL